MRFCIENKDLRLKHGDAVYYFCKTCGSEMYATLDPSFTKKQKKLFKKSTCMQCNNELSYVKGYYYFTHTSDSSNIKENESWFCDKDIKLCEEYDIDKSFKHMNEVRRVHEQQLAQNAVEKFCEDNISVNTICAINPYAEDILKDKSKLKEYLHNLIKIESNIYSLSKRLEALYLRRIYLDREIEAKKISYLHRMDKPLEDAQIHYRKCLEKYNDIKDKKPRVERANIERPIEPIPPTLETPGWFNKKKVLERNEYLQARYEEELKTYRYYLDAHEREKIQLIEINNRNAQELSLMIKKAYENMKEAEAVIEQLQYEAQSCVVSEDVIAPLILKKSLITKEVENAEEVLKKLVQCRDELYSYNIVFSKYQNWIAITAFYEYLMSGRCETLEGSNGAYNIYETEIRANLVINKLSQIVESLEQVKENQYILYSELVTINKNIDSLNKSMNTALRTFNEISNNVANMTSQLKNISQNTETIAQNTEVIVHNSEVIAYNTATTAYYSKINVELTNALGYMIAFK